MASNHNPFAPPSQEAEAGEDEVFGEDEQLVNASRGTRFVNSLIDNFGQWLLALLMGGMVGGARALFGVGPSEEVVGLVVLLLMPGYHVFFEYFFNKTPAKWLTRTRVVRVDGGRPRFMQIVGRTLARYVPFEPLSFLSKTVGWHDRWSGTRVVRDTR